MKTFGTSQSAAEQNASSLALYIGKSGVLRCEYLSVDVTVADAKRSYGRTLLLVRPVAGSGDQWVEESRIRWPENEGERVRQSR